MTKVHNLKQPRQRLSFKQKTKTWRKDNVDAADRYSFYHNTGVRKSLENKMHSLSHWYPSSRQLENLSQTK